MTLPLPEYPSVLDTQHMSHAVQFYLCIFQEAWTKEGLYVPYFRMGESLTKALSSSTLNW